jgi:hypothetical protein
MELLQRLQSNDLRFLFSSQLVPPSLTVRTEPAVRTPIETVRDVLADHGLALESVESGVWAVVPAASPRNRATVVSSAAPQAVDPIAEVIVSVSRYELGDDIGPSVTMDAAALGDQPGIGNDPLRSLERLPGISSNGASVRSNVRGSDSQESLLLLDGFPLRQPFHLAGYQSLFSILDAGLIDSAEVFTGGFPVRYGNRTAAVFDLHSIDPGRDSRESVGVDFFNATARAASDDGPWQSKWLGLGRIGTLRPLLQVFAPSAGAPTYSDAYFKATRGDTATLRVTGNVLLSHDELAITDEVRGEQAHIEGSVNYVWLELERDWRNVQAIAWVGQTRIESQREGSAVQPGVVDAHVSDGRDSRLTDLRGLLRWQIATHQSFEGGIELTHASGRYDYQSQARYPLPVTAMFGRDAELDRDVHLAARRDQAALFASHRWRLTGGLTSEVGLRAQRLATRGESRNWLFDPRMGLRWELDSRTNLKLHWGRFHQIDEINELQVEDGRTVFENPQRSEHRILGIERQLDDRISLRLEAFEKRQSRPRPRFENLLNQQTILPEVAPDRVELRPTFAQSRGVELSASYRQGPLSVWTSLSGSRAFDRFGDRSELRSWDQTWALTGGARWSRGPWLLSGALNFHRGWPTTEVLESPEGAASLGARNAARLAVYVQIDLRAQYTWQLAHSDLAFSAEVVNAQGTANECCSELRTAPEGPAVLTARQLYWLPVVPSLGVRWTF